MVPMSFYFSDVEGDVNMLEAAHKACEYVVNSLDKITDGDVQRDAIVQHMHVVFGGDAGDIEYPNGEIGPMDDTVNILAECAKGTLKPGHFDLFNNADAADAAGRVSLIFGNRDLNKLRFLPSVDAVYPEFISKIYGDVEPEHTCRDEECTRECRREFLARECAQWPLSTDRNKYYDVFEKTLVVYPAIAIHQQALLACLCRLVVMVNETMNAGKNQSGAQNCTGCNGLLMYFIGTCVNYDAEQRNMMSHLITKVPKMKGVGEETYDASQLATQMMDLVGHYVSCKAHLDLHTLVAQLLRHVYLWITNGAIKKYLTQGKLSHCIAGEEVQIASVHASMHAASPSNDAMNAASPSNDAMNVLNKTLPDKVIDHNKLGDVWVTPVKTTTSFEEWSSAQNRLVQDAIGHLFDPSGETPIDPSESWKWVIALGGPYDMGPANAALQHPKPFEVANATGTSTGDETVAKQTVWQLGHIPNAVPLVGRLHSPVGDVRNSNPCDYAVRVDTQYKRPSFCVAMTMHAELAKPLCNRMQAVEYNSVKKNLFEEATTGAVELLNLDWFNNKIACRLNEISTLNYAKRSDFEKFLSWQKDPPRRTVTYMWAGPCVYLPYRFDTLAHLEDLTLLGRETQRLKQCKDELTTNVAMYRIVYAVQGFDARVLFVPKGAVQENDKMEFNYSDKVSTLLLGRLVVPSGNTDGNSVHFRKLVTNGNFEGTPQNYTPSIGEMLTQNKFREDAIMLSGKAMQVIPYFAFTHDDNMCGCPLEIVELNNSFSFKRTQP